MVFTDRFRTHTLAKISDAAVAALLTGLLYPRATLPPGVFEASAERLRDAHARFSWAADYLAAEIAAAPGITVCSSTGLGVVWSEIHHPRIDNPSMARGRGRQIARTAASFMSGIIGELRGTLSEAAAEAMKDAYKAELVAMRREGSQIPRQRAAPRQNEFDRAAVRAKQMEHEFRAEFDGVVDLGAVPGAADRRAVVNIMSTGVSSAELFKAMEGRAAQCRRARMWDGLDTAEQFLRIVWLCASPRRFADALAAAPVEDVRGQVLRTEHGTFVGGREVAV